MWRLRYKGERPIPDYFEIIFYDDIVKVINGEVVVEKEYHKDRLLKLGFEEIKNEEEKKEEGKVSKKKKEKNNTDNTVND